MSDKEPPERDQLIVYVGSVTLKSVRMNVATFILTDFRVTEPTYTINWSRSGGSLSLIRLK